ncbi:WD repeat-containing protein 62 [Hyperolius riggenbachi]|uniref:WD repeat-containing protein 62 n=1 Tax=Hyperolius riggenbachi TaxID=752182 RepID=UPI0035A29FB5
MEEIAQQQRAHTGLLPFHSPPGRRRSSRGAMAGHGRSSRQAELEKVLGVTVSGSSSLTCDPKTGLIAYPAGCVIVLLCPKKNKQTHILNTCSKQLSALSFSPDGKYIVSGESGHKPAVRIWDVAEKAQVSEMLGHKYGVSCVCFSPNMKYVVSVGYQHDMVVNVWDWKNSNLVAKNKVSSKVSAVSFSEDSSYFVTAGHRHVKFWYLECSKQSSVGTVPLVGRSGLLGDLHNNIFGGVACGKGKNARSTFCVSFSGILCQFSERRILDKWLKLKVSASYCLTATEQFVFCGCEEGVVRIFSAQNLQYVTDLPRPHHLGVDVALGLDPSSLFVKQTDASYPDTCAVVYDGRNQWLCCVYNDHSIYVWDVSNTRKVGKVYSALYHSSYIWNIEVYPECGKTRCLTKGSFFTCSSDNTIRLWNLEKNSYPSLKRNVYSNDLHKVIYAEDNIQYLKDTSASAEKAEPKDSKSGVRVLKVRHDGRQLASGDRMGNIRIYDLQSCDEMLTVEAHDGEVLCLEYSRPLTGDTLLASASRDRLIHVLSVNQDYSLLQTLDDHSSSITAVKFAGDAEQMHMISCGADKSIYFRPAQVSSDGIHFVRLHHVVEKTTLYDLDIDVTQKTAAVACQDKTIRLYNISSGKQEKTLKSSQATGALLKVQMDHSGRFFATSCSNKNISVFDLQSGECVAVMYGHSEIVTDMKFTYDCKRLITVSGDSCVFVWQLDPIMTTCMKQQVDEASLAGKTTIVMDENSHVTHRREVFFADFLDESSHDELFLDKSTNNDEPSLDTPSREHPDIDPTFLQTNGKMPLWVKKLQGDKDEPLAVLSQNHYKPQGRWAQSDNTDVLRTFLNSNEISYCCTGQPEDSFLDSTLDTGHIEPKSFQQMLEQSEEGNEDYGSGTFIMNMSAALEVIDAQSCDSTCIVYPSSLQTSQQEESDFAIEEHSFDKGHNAPTIELSSASCDQDDDSLASCDLEDHEVEEISRPETPEQESYLRKHFDTLNDALAEEKFDNDLNDLKHDEDDCDSFLNHRLSFSAKFLCQNHQRNDRRACAFSPRAQQGATLTSTEAKSEGDRVQPSRRLSDRPAEKSQGKERRKSAATVDMTISIPSLQKVQANDKAATRASLPAYWTNKNSSLNKSNKGPSYMEATASSKAKILRSVSMGEGLNGTEDQKRLPNMFRPLSTTDLSTEQNTFQPAEDLCRPPSCSTTSENEERPEQHEAKSKPTASSKCVSDKLLMPPPTTYGINQRLKKKAKSVNNLSKQSRKEELNVTVVKSKGTDVQKNAVTNGLKEKRSLSPTNRLQEVHAMPRRASIAECSARTTPIDHSAVSSKERACSPGATLKHLCTSPTTLSTSPTALPSSPTQLSNSPLHLSTSPNLSASPTSFSSLAGECSGSPPGERLLMTHCEQVIEELHGAFQRTLKTYKEIESCEASLEEKDQLRSLFSDAFTHIQSEIELLGIDQSGNSSGQPEAPKNSTLHLLEHYSEMMLQLMREKVDNIALYNGFRKGPDGVEYQ